MDRNGLELEVIRLSFWTKVTGRSRKTVLSSVSYKIVNSVRNGDLVSVTVKGNVLEKLFRASEDVSSTS